MVLEKLTDSKVENGRIGMVLAWGGGVHCKDALFYHCLNYSCYILSLEYGQGKRA